MPRPVPFPGRIIGSSILLCLAALTANAEKRDMLDPSLSILKALESVECACICREGDGEKDRVRILRLLGELELHRAEDGRYVELAPWMADGIRGGDDGVRMACARLFRMAGLLYGCTGYAAAGRAEEERMLAGGTSGAGFRDVASVPETVREYDALMALNRTDLHSCIHPGGVGGRPFWNGNARVFIYPPSFDFKPVAGAVRYRFEVLDDLHREHVFEAEAATASLSPIWPKVPVGCVTVFCHAIDAAGKRMALAGRRTFWRNAPFDPLLNRPAIRTYDEACRRALEYLFRWPDIGYMERHGAPDISKGSNFTSYPSKMQSAVIDVMLLAARRFPESRERAMKIARVSADYLLRTRQPAGTPLEYFTATYVGEGQLSGTYSGQHMLVYPANAGAAFVRLHKETGDPSYLDAAEKIARTYLRLQGDDGTWCLKMNEKDGSPVSRNRLLPTGVIEFLEELYRVTGLPMYRIAADRAFAFIESGPLKDWNWEGQFEDIVPSRTRYQNLTKHNACSTAIYLLKRFPGDMERLRQAREILRYAEDQFVMWKAPCRSDGSGMWTPIYPFFAWKVPAVLEQYSCYSPIDASAAKLIRTYLALYNAEGNPLDLAKARALGCSMVDNQDSSGRIRTYWIPEPGDSGPLAGAIRLPRGGDWYNCMMADVMALEQLSDTVESPCR